MCGEGWNIDGETQLSWWRWRKCVLELQDGAGKENLCPWIDFCDAGIWVYLRKGNPTLLGPTQIPNHYSGNLYFQTRGRVSRWDQKVYYAFMVSHLIGELFWKNPFLFILCYPCRQFREDSAQGRDKVPEAGGFPAHVPSPQFGFLHHSTSSAPLLPDTNPPDSV